jgi:hypothetical protein
MKKPEQPNPFGQQLPSVAEEKKDEQKIEPPKVEVNGSNIFSQKQPQGSQQTFG